jgi:hypothetical protein
MIQVTFEFPSIEAAIVAMGKLADMKPAPKPGPALAATMGPDGEIKYGPPAPPAAKKVDAEVKPTAAKTDAPKAPRKGRSDKGKPRGAHAPAAAPEVAPAAPAAAPEVAPEVAPAAPEAPAATQADAQTALEKLFNAKGVEAAMGVLSRFGAGRLRELKPEMYGEFVAKCNAVLAGGTA